MARIRTIKPEFWESETISKLSLRARLLYIGSWNLADDEGLVPFTAAFLRSRIFPYDDVTLAEISQVMSELVTLGLVMKYEAGGDTFGWIVRFRVHQKINRPLAAKHPLPPSIDAKTLASRDRFRCYACGLPIAETDSISVLKMGNQLSDHHAVHAHCMLTDDAVSTHGQLTEDAGPKPYSTVENDNIPALSEDSVSTHENCAGEQGSGIRDQGSGNREQGNKNPQPPPLTLDGNQAPKRSSQPPKNYTPGFESWWSVYPRKAGKREAFEKWWRAVTYLLPIHSNSEAAVEGFLVRSAYEFAKQTAASDPKFIMHASRWLHNRRWEDMPDPEPSRGLSGRDRFGVGG